jgi:transcription antitermination factor NusG
MGNTPHIAWFALITRWGQWKKIPERLKEFGVGCYIPPSYNTLVFLHTGKDRALNLVNAGEIKGHFIIDHNTHTLLEVPDDQMEAFIRVTTEHPEAVISPEVPIQKGARVQVIRGSLKGVQGEVVESPSGTAYLVVRILSLLSAKVSIPREDLTLIEG